MEIHVTVENVDLTANVGTHRVYDEEDGWCPEPMTLGQAVAEEVVRQLMKTDQWNSARRLVEEIRKEEIRDAVRQEIGHALTTSVQTTNTWGEPTGAPTTLRGIIHAQAKDFLEKPDRYDHETAMRKLIRKEVDAALVAELKGTITSAKETVVGAVQAKAAELIAAAVKEGLRR